MVQRDKREKRCKKAILPEVEKYPKPPEEHAYELKMEKRLKRMLKEPEKKARKNPL